MKWLRIILFPVVPIYYLVTKLRNWLYDKDIKASKSYDFPVICVGNLSVGGTGKTPVIEYLIRLLKDDFKVAVLSRGYKRSTEGFVLADEKASAETIGDEPFQFYNKFKDDVTVAVDGNRQHGIQQLKQSVDLDVILLDDAFQHRKLKAGLNILLTMYDKLYVDDWLLPTGDLREPISGAKRAQMVVVTKCPSDLSEAKKNDIAQKLNLKPDQKLFFSSISYSDFLYRKAKVGLASLVNSDLTVVTGIANPQPFVDYLKNKRLNFEHLSYPDHHNFSFKEVERLEKKDVILTTEKDYMRLKQFDSLVDKLYYLPIEFTIDKPVEFEKLVKEFTAI